MKNTSTHFKPLLILLMFMFCIQDHIKAQSKSVILEVANKSKMAYTHKVMEIPWASILQKWETIDTSKLIVLDAATQEQIIFQLDINTNNQIQNLLVQLSIPPSQSSKILLTYGNRKNFTTKTFGRYVPERKEDFAWENDRIAFRMYGKELEKTPAEMGYGMDVWVKRTERMILNERYKRGEYHIDHGDGMDYYHVGYSLGAGSMMPIYHDSIYYSKNYVSYKVLNNGPLRTTFQLIYDAWSVGANTVKATKTISLDAGSQFNKITVDYDGVQDSVWQVAAGLVLREGKGIKYEDEQNGIMAYWEPMHGADGTTGVACIFTNPVNKMIEQKGQLLAKSNTSSRHSITYYAGAVWDRAGLIKNADEWIAFVKHFKMEME